MTLLKLLIVDDHPVFRQGLRDVFETDPQIHVVGEAIDGETALEQAQETQADVVLMDINLPATSGLQVTRALAAQDQAPKVVMITAYDEPEYVFHSLKAGASAFYSKDMTPDSMIRTVHYVSTGKYVINDQIMSEEEVNNWLQQRMDRFGKRPFDLGPDSRSSLSPREMEILELVCQGTSNKEIAKRLGISYQTVKIHVTSVLYKLGVSDKTQAVLFAFKHGWFPLESAN